ncbi:MAG: hypothetical protein ACLUYS_06850 [Allobaculum sp.]
MLKHLEIHLYSLPANQKSLYFRQDALLWEDATFSITFCPNVFEFFLFHRHFLFPHAGAFWRCARFSPMETAPISDGLPVPFSFCFFSGEAVTRLPARLFSFQIPL